ncbi:MAG TPA: phosphate ABC transporter substrate-binding protein PstS [Bryobacteraceae bacterium]|jgi:phosphate transport system substrate-binding protein|nr:phosphate ABC transporter substrate-binding protein PstS [Bryobacteraceae bacterium]
MKKSLWLGALGALAILLTVAEAKVLINAAGATFPYPIYGKWFQEYTKVDADAQINYQSVGSGGGIRMFSEGTVDFGASDMPMTDEQIGKFKTKPFHFPTVLGGVVLTYNIPGVTQDLKFTPDALAGIYLGKIKKWNDPELTKANPGVKLPDAEIVVAHRSDGSGTSFVFTDYLCKVSPEWKSKVGSSTSVQWPVGIGGKGNEGVTGVVKQTPNSVGYVELIYALEQKMPYGYLRNASGTFLKADLESVTEAAAAAARNMPADFRVSITNQPGKKTYPISTFTYLLIPSKIDDAAKKKAITGFLRWMLKDGQKDAAGLGYAPLPKNVVAQEEKQIALIK